jgi:hypothetical protein
MAAWEYTVVLSTVGAVFGPDVAKVWTAKDAAGVSDWDRIQQLGQEGWELVSCCPAAGGGGMIYQILWTFKRPVNG